MNSLIYIICLSAVLSLASSHQKQYQSIFDHTLELFQKHFMDHLPPSLFQSNITASPPCSLCHSIFSTLQYIPAKQTIKVLERIATQYCVYKKLQVKQVCKGAVGAMTGFMLKGLWEKFTDPHSICHKIKLCPKEYTILNANDYAKQLLKDKPNKTQEDPTQRKILNIIHLSDVHIDFFYSEGTPSSCDQPLCCRNGVNAKNGSTLAGYWGSNKGDCDLPFHTFKLFLQQIKDKNIDAIIWTGDNTAHDIWRQSEAYNANFTTIISNLIKQKLPHVKIIPTFGNHESFPVNVYKFGKQQFLNEILSEAWSDWIGKQAVEKLQQNGFFSFRIDQYNLTAISLNTQAWNDMNWALIKDPTDPGGMLKWMEEVLRQAEKNNDKVYILGHIPPNAAIVEWGRRYNALVDRFSYIIRGQFFGHSHRQHIAFFSSINDTNQRIIGNYFLPPSLTTYASKNPNYRIMKVDLDTMRVLDYDQYALKLQKNYTKNERPSFELTYSFLKQYNLSSLSFQNFQLFRHNLRTDNATQIKYSFHTHADLSPGKPSATLHCETYAIDQMVDKCAKGGFKPSNFQKVTGPWRVLNH